MPPTKTKKERRNRGRSQNRREEAHETTQGPTLPCGSAAQVLLSCIQEPRGSGSRFSGKQKLDAYASFKLSYAAGKRLTCSARLPPLGLGGATPSGASNAAYILPVGAEANNRRERFSAPVRLLRRPSRYARPRKCTTDLVSLLGFVCKRHVPATRSLMRKAVEHSVVTKAAKR